MQQTKNRPLWWIILTLGAAILLTLAVACGDDDDDSTGDDDDGSPVATTPAAGDDDDDDDAPSDDDDDDGGDDDDVSGLLGELEDFAGDYEGATGVVTYDFISEGETLSWTIYSDGTNSRVDVDSADGGFITITTPTESYFCSASGGTGFCFPGGEGSGDTNPYLGLFTGFASSAAIFTYLDAFSDVDVSESSENIAGVDANCYQASGDLVGDSGTLKWCFSDSGLLLLAQYDLESGDFEMRATSFSDNVPGDAFEPPYEVTNFGQ